MKRSRAAIGTALVTSTLTSLALIAPPAANAATTAETITKWLVGPLQMDIDFSDSGARLVVAQSFAGLITEVTEDGPGFGGSKGGNLQRDIGSRDELKEEVGDGDGVTRVRDSDKPEQANLPRYNP